MDRAYTVKEIDDLRKVCKDRLIYGSSDPKKWPWEPNGLNGGRMCVGRCSPTAKKLEETIRTYMLAGITADDILNEDRKP